MEIYPDQSKDSEYTSRRDEMLEMLEEFFVLNNIPTHHATSVMVEIIGNYVGDVEHLEALLLQWLALIQKAKKEYGTQNALEDY